MNTEENFMWKGEKPTTKPETRKVRYYVQLWPGWTAEHPPSPFITRPEKVWTKGNVIVAIDVELPVLDAPIAQVIQGKVVQE